MRAAIGTSTIAALAKLWLASFPPTVITREGG
jgi:hypothetical protein